MRGTKTGRHSSNPHVRSNPAAPLASCASLRAGSSVEGREVQRAAWRERRGTCGTRLRSPFAAVNTPLYPPPGPSISSPTLVLSTPHPSSHNLHLPHQIVPPPLHQPCNLSDHEVPPCPRPRLPPARPGRPGRAANERESLGAGRAVLACKMERRWPRDLWDLCTQGARPTSHPPLLPPLPSRRATS